MPSRIFSSGNLSDSGDDRGNSRHDTHPGDTHPESDSESLRPRRSFRDRDGVIHDAALPPRARSAERPPSPPSARLARLDPLQIPRPPKLPNTRARSNTLARAAAKLQPAVSSPGRDEGWVYLEASQFNRVHPQSVTPTALDAEARGSGSSKKSIALGVIGIAAGIACTLAALELIPDREAPTVARARQTEAKTAMMFVAPKQGNDPIAQAPSSAALPRSKSPLVTEKSPSQAVRNPTTPIASRSVAKPETASARSPTAQGPSEQTSSASLIASMSATTNPNEWRATENPYDDPTEPAAVQQDAPKAPESATSSSEQQAAAPFDRQAARMALLDAMRSASACGDGTGPVRARVAVTFAPSGRATVAVIEGGTPLKGTAAGSCVAKRMRQVTVPPFGGEKVTVHSTVVVD